MPGGGGWGAWRAEQGSEELKGQGGYKVVLAAFREVLLIQHHIEPNGESQSSFKRGNGMNEMNVEKGHLAVK